MVMSWVTLGEVGSTELCVRIRVRGDMLGGETCVQ